MRVGAGAEKAPIFDRIAQPGALFENLDVIGLVADRAGVGLAQLLDAFQRIARFRRERPAHNAGRQRCQERLIHAMDIHVQAERAVWRAAERVDMCIEVALLANVADQPRRADRAGDVKRCGAAGAFRHRRCMLGRRRPLLEKRARLGVDRLRVGAVAVVQLKHIAGVGAVEGGKIIHRISSLHGFVIIKTYAVGALSLR